uniref:Uncharacterized protein n=1 Tax=Rhizophagus irregularis (strain DAOM 181602 / DAOM 197198 / MUCL 43194) TaxID=747089 RepID=U9URT2_RHIID
MAIREFFLSRNHCREKVTSRKWIHRNQSDNVFRLQVTALQNPENSPPGMTALDNLIDRKIDDQLVIRLSYKKENEN